MREESDAPEAGRPARRRSHAASSRQRRINARFNDDEHARVLALAGAAGLSPAAYVAKAALRGGSDPEQLPLELAAVDPEVALLRTLLGLQRELEEAVEAGAGPAVEAVAERIDAAVSELGRRRR